jgi:hypothetical protein
MAEANKEENKNSESWIKVAALTSALLAVCTAITTLQAGGHSSRVLLNNIAASNQWSYYQAKSVKFNILKSETDILKALGRKADRKVDEKMAEYQAEMDGIKKNAEDKQALAEKNAKEGAVLGKAVTLFQVAIAMSAITLLIKRKGYWYFGLCLAAGGVYFVIIRICFT